MGKFMYRAVKDEERSGFYRHYCFDSGDSGVGDVIMFMRLEQYIYSVAARVLPEYRGGYWGFFLLQDPEGKTIPLFLLPGALEGKTMKYQPVFGGDVFDEEGDALVISFAINVLATNHFAGLLGDSKDADRLYALSARILDAFYSLVESEEGEGPFLDPKEARTVFFNLID